MDGDVILAVVSLAGVAVGGGITFASQWINQRAETRRHAANVLEMRRTERLSRLVEFLETAQDAERVAVERSAQGKPDDEWRRRAGLALDRLWTAQKTVHLLCDEKVTAASHAFARDVHNSIRQDEPDDELWTALRPSRRAFLDAARADLDRMP